MISSKCFSKEWLQEQKDALQVQDVRNLEKCALALELVARLRKAGLEFIFKGGTSLLLLTDQPRRLSIDVDILCLESLEKLEEVLDKVVGQPFFCSLGASGTPRPRGASNATLPVGL